jgi:hypothetical protein
MLCFNFCDDDQSSRTVSSPLAHPLTQPSEVINAVADRQKRFPRDRDLMMALATLYASMRRYERTLNIYFEMKHPDIFGLIEQRRLFGAVKDKILGSL